jgi:CheY-like chemotaxis protein
MQFVFAYSGTDALGYLKYVYEAVLILSDINMPTISKLELLRRIKIGYPASPPVVMIITAYGDPENFKQAKQLGADDFPSKPLDFNLLKEKLKDNTDA